MCQIDVLYGKSLIIDFLDDFLKKRTAIVYILISLCIRRASILKQEFEFNSFIVDNDHVLLNITFGFDMPIRLLMNKIYLVNSNISHLIGMSDPNVMFQGLGPIPYIENFEITSETILMEHFPDESSK